MSERKRNRSSGRSVGDLDRPEVRLGHAEELRLSTGHGAVELGVPEQRGTLAGLAVLGRLTLGEQPARAHPARAAGDIKRNHDSVSRLDVGDLGAHFLDDRPSARDPGCLRGQERPKTSYRCRSEPQIADDVTRMIASVGCSIRGSGTSLTRTSRLPCQVKAFTRSPFKLLPLSARSYGDGPGVPQTGVDNRDQVDRLKNTALPVHASRRECQRQHEKQPPGYSKAMTTNSRTIKTAPGKVWQVLSDGWLYPVWVVGATRMRDVDRSWPAEGTRLHHSAGVWPLVIDDNTEVLECEPGRTLRLRAKGWPLGEAEVCITLSPEGAHTLVEIDEDAVSGPGTLLPTPSAPGSSRSATSRPCVGWRSLLSTGTWTNTSRKCS